jgi:hypothetical protein
LATIYKYKKGDVVMVDESGKAVKYEILSVLSPNKGQRDMVDLCYEAKNVTSGSRKTILQDDILRLATPIDSSAELFTQDKQ